MARVTGTLNEDLCAVVTVCCSVLLRMRNVSGKSVEKIKTYICVFIMVFIDDVEKY
jgi:hypothetical protein